jgi:hypothetical protein
VWAGADAFADQPRRLLDLSVRGGQIGGKRVTAIVGRAVRAGSPQLATTDVAFGLPGALSYLGWPGAG